MLNATNDVLGESVLGLVGTKYKGITLVSHIESTQSSKIFVVLPKTSSAVLNEVLQKYTDTEVAAFRNSTATSPAVTGFYNQLSIMPHIDYASDDALSVSLQVDEYRTNKDATTKTNSWLVSNNKPEQIVLDDINLQEISAAMGVRSDQLSSRLYGPIGIGFLPDYTAKLYIDGPEQQPFVKTVDVDALPHVAGKIKTIFYKDYPTQPTKNQKKQLHGMFAAFNKRNIAAPNCSTEKCVALTFDDGPHAEITPKVLDILREKGVKASFFVLGQNVEKYPTTITRMHNEGYEIENHSYNHPSFDKLKSTGQIRQQIDQTHNALLGLGVDAQFLRPPYGAVNPRVQTIANMPLILWNVDPQEWRASANTDSFERSVTARARNGAIILMHDTHQQTADGLADIIDRLSQRGYRMVTVRQLLAIDGSARGRFFSAP